MAMVVRNGAVDEFTYSSVDLQGKPVHKSKTGGWTACFFVVGNKLLHLSLFLFHLQPTVLLHFSSPISTISWPF